MQSKKSVFAVIIIIVSMLLLVVALYFLLRNRLEDKENNELVEQLIQEAITKEEIKAESTTNEEILSINWNNLKEINEDIIGWIKIEDTNINYPILQDKNLYYLKHTYTKKWNSNGSIFVIDNNPFEANKTIVYGHNMRNSIMFSELGKYLDKDFFNTHKYFKIYTQEKIYKATVFSCYSIDLNVEENNIKNLDFNQEIQYYKDKSKFKIDNIQNVKKIVKLSTCSYLNNKRIPTEQRYFIIAKIEEI